MAFRGDYNKTIDYNHIVEKNATSFEKILRELVFFVCSDPFKPNENTYKLFNKYDELYALMRKHLATELKIPENRFNMDPHKEADMWEALGKQFFTRQSKLQLGPIELHHDLAENWRAFTQIAINNHEYICAVHHCISDSISRYGKRFALLLHFATHDGEKDAIESQINALKLERQDTYKTLRVLTKSKTDYQTILQEAIDSHHKCLTHLGQQIESLQIEILPTEFSKNVITLVEKLFLNRTDPLLKQTLKKMEIFEEYLDLPFKKIPVRMGIGYIGSVIAISHVTSGVPTNYRNQLSNEKLAAYKKKLNVLKNDLRKIKEFSNPGKSDKEFAVILNKKFRDLLIRYKLDKEYERLFSATKIREEKETPPLLQRKRG